MSLIPFSRYKIVGHSMEPTFHEGEIVWVYTWAYIFNEPKVGDVVIFRLEKQSLVKRVAGVKDNKVILFGDNSRDSFDSKEFGEVVLSQVVGKVLNKNKQGS